MLKLVMIGILAVDLGYHFENLCTILVNICDTFGENISEKCRNAKQNLTLLFLRLFSRLNYLIFVLFLIHYTLEMCTLLKIENN